MKFQKIMKNNFLFLFFIYANTLYADNSNDQDSQIIQPGAPGKPSIILNQNEATNIANSSYTKADVNFVVDEVRGGINVLLNALHNHKNLDYSPNVSVQKIPMNVMDTCK